MRNVHSCFLAASERAFRRERSGEDNAPNFGASDYFNGSFPIAKTDERFQT